MAEARQLAMRAMRHLKDFPASPTTRALAEICDFVLNRQV